MESNKNTPRTGPAMKRIALLITLAATLVCAPAAHALTPTQQIAALKRQNTMLRAQLATAKRQAAARLIRAQLAEADMVILKDMVASTTAARDAALAGLPSAIGAVPLASFAELVFAPAKAAAQRAGCGDSFYSSDGYVSYTFHLGKFCA